MVYRTHTRTPYIYIHRIYVYMYALLKKENNKKRSLCQASFYRFIYPDSSSLFSFSHLREGKENKQKKLKKKIDPLEDDTISSTMDWTVFILIPFLSSFVPFVDPLVKLRKSPSSHFARVCVCVWIESDNKKKRKNKQQKTTCQLNNLKHFKNNLSRINKCIRLT